MTLITAVTAEIVTILSGFGEGVVNDIRRNMASTGTDASGESSRSLRYEVIEDGFKATLRVLAKPFFMVVETGRKATPEYKPSIDFVNRIKSWLSSRGKDQGPAYAIARTIHKKGTKLWQAGGRTDIVSNVVNETLVDQIAKASLHSFAQQYLVSLVNSFNDAKRN
jgi:hypothetical protein